MEPREPRERLATPTRQWLAEHGLPAAVGEAAEASAAKLCSLATVAAHDAALRPALALQLTMAFGVCEEHVEMIGQPSRLNELLSVLHEMAFSRAVGRSSEALERRSAHASVDEDAATAGSDSQAEEDCAEAVVLVVVARYREEVGWLDQLPPGVDYHVMQKDALQRELPADKQTLLSNVGRESHSYLSYFELATRTGEGGGAHATPPLPQCVVCTQADPFDHNPAFVEEIGRLARDIASGCAVPRFAPIGLWSGGERLVECDPSGAPHSSTLLPIGAAWRALFGERRALPLWLRFTPGAMFAVSRHALLRPQCLQAGETTSEVYGRLRRDIGLESSADPVAGHVMERLWRYVFVDHADHDERRAHAALPPPALPVRVSGLGLRYLLYPCRQADEGAVAPLLLYLHGARSRGADESLLLLPGTPPALAAAGAPQLAGYTVACPQTRSSSWGSRLERSRLIGLVDELLAEPALRLDRERVILAGSSMGGDGVWAVGGAFPDRFAACVAVCAAANLEAAASLCRTPVWLAHGANDHVVPVGASDAMADALRRAGAEVRYDRIEECPTPERAPHAEGHAAWERAFGADSGLWGWLRSLATVY